MNKISPFLITILFFLTTSAVCAMDSLTALVQAHDKARKAERARHCATKMQLKKKVCSIEYFAPSTKKKPAMQEHKEQIPMPVAPREQSLFDLKEALKEARKLRDLTQALLANHPNDQNFKNTHVFWENKARECAAAIGKLIKP